MVARIATLSRNRRPHINPLYFVYVSGRIYLGTSDRTLAALNVRKNPRVTILFNVEKETTQRGVLQIRGRATVRTEPRMCRWYVLRDACKYFMSWAGLHNTLLHVGLLPLVRRYFSSGEKGKPCLLEVIPEKAALRTAPEGARQQNRE
jgi:hypothetical protein